jgi:hypothetical protein
MKRLLASVAIVGSVGLGFATPAFAGTGNPNGTGQPSQTCLSGTAPIEPGHAGSAPGSAFNENGGTAGAVYAGNGVSAQTANSSHAVSQYDVACYQVSPH